MPTYYEDYSHDGYGNQCEGDHPYSQLDGNDLARISWLCLTSNVKNEIFNVSDGSPITVTYFYKEICKIVGLKMPPEISMDEAYECFSEKRLSFLRESRILDISKMKKFFPGQIKYSKS